MGKLFCDMKNTCLEVPGTFGFTKKELFVTENGPDDDSHEIQIFIDIGGKLSPQGLPHGGKVFVSKNFSLRRALFYDHFRR